MTTDLMRLAIVRPVQRSGRSFDPRAVPRYIDLDAMLDAKYQYTLDLAKIENADLAGPMSDDSILSKLDNLLAINKDAVPPGNIRDDLRVWVAQSLGKPYPFQLDEAEFDDWVRTTLPILLHRAAEAFVVAMVLAAPTLKAPFPAPVIDDSLTPEVVTKKKAEYEQDVQAYGQFRKHLVEQGLLPDVRHARNELLRRVYAGALLQEVVADTSHQLGVRPLPATVTEIAHVPVLVRDAVLLLPKWLPTPSIALARIPGMADLCVVRQWLDRYEAGEITHIENVLCGERRQRQHRVHHLSEETLTAETEREEETAEDLQTTDRFELEREVSKTVQDDLKLEAGVNVTARYGTMVEASSNIGASISSSTNETTRTATRYAHDVVQRSAHKVRERSRQERVTRMLIETEEKNLHGFDNPADSGADVTGIYRFVDKVYKAQVYNYGKRLLAEFIVPQPAFFLRYAAAQLPDTVKPPTFTPVGGSERPLQAADLTAENYLGYLTEFEVSTGDLPHCPAPVMNKTARYDAQQGSSSHLHVTGTIKIPDGYAATSAVCNFAGSGCEEAKQGFWWQLSIGDKMQLDGWGDKSHPNTVGTGMTENLPLYEFVFGSPITDEVPVSIDGGPMGSLSAHVTVRCELIAPDPAEVTTKTEKKVTTTDGVVVTIETTTKLPTTRSTNAQWQAEIYGAVMNGYRRLLLDREEVVADDRSARAAVSTAEHRAIERGELKKHILDMLGTTTVHDPWPNPVKEPQDAVPAGDTHPAVPARPPSLELDAVVQIRDDIQFFEQAFEWAQLTYVLYPYYWALPDRWKTLIAEQDGDAMYQDFLRSGAARVVVPVRPGFEAAVNLALATGITWAGERVPQVDTPMYLSIVDEIRSMQDTLGGVEVGEPWEVRLPTNLVILQSQVKQLKGIADTPPAPQTRPITNDRLDGVPIPATAGRVSWYGGPGDTFVPKTDTMTLTGEPTRHPTDTWYCAMRWPYVDGVKDKAWYAGRKVIVSRDGRRVVLRAADYGPSPATGRAINVSPQALAYLDVATDDEVAIGWAADQSLSTGPLTQATPA